MTKEEPTLPDCSESVVRGFIQGKITPERQMVSRLQLLLLMSSLPLARRWTRGSSGHWNCSSGLNLELTWAEEVMFCWLSSVSWPPPPPPPPPPPSLYPALSFGTCPELIAKVLPCSCSGRADCWGSMDPAHQTVSNKTRNPSTVVKTIGLLSI